jgi:4-hydroxy-2-oxoheptanedioate aldolase
MRVNHVKHALQEGKVQVGTWIHTLGSLQVPQVLATAGFDYLKIDMEHSSLSIETVGNLCFAALNAGLTPIVRPAGTDHHHISRPLDNGAMGILMPHVDTREQAEAVVRAVKFPPLGVRGSQPPNVHTNFGPSKVADHMAASNMETMILVQIESPQAIANIDEIMSVPGVDGATVGRGDLAAELGVGGQRDHPDVLAGVEAMVAAALRHGKIPGLLVQNVAEADEWIGKGVRLITYASETILMRLAGERAVQDIRAAASRPRP